MSAPETLEVVVINLGWTSPTFGASKDNHWPLGTHCLARLSALFLDLLNLHDTSLEGCSHCLMHRVGLASLDKVWLPSVADKQCFELRMWDSGKDGGVVDLVSVEVQHWEYGAVGDGIQKLVAVPARGQGTSFGLAISNHGQSNEVGVVEDGTESMQDRVPKLTTLMNAAGSFWGAMTANAAREGELLEELLQARDGLGLFGVHF